MPSIVRTKVVQGSLFLLSLKSLLIFFFRVKKSTQHIIVVLEGEERSAFLFTSTVVFHASCPVGTISYAS